MNNDVPARSFTVTTASPDLGSDATDLPDSIDDTQVLATVEDSAADTGELDPFTDDLASELAAASSKTWRNRATIALAAIAILAVGFLGGALVQKNFGKTATASAAGRGIGGATGFAGGFGRGAGGNARGSGTGGAGAGTGAGTSRAGASQTGVIKLIDGSTIYVQLANGDVVTVRTNDATKVSLASTTKVASLKKGQQVTVTGSTDSSSGTVTATSVTASAATSK